MRVELFDFDLPEERIALRPASPRDAARMLVVRPGEEPPLDDRTVRDLPDLLRPGDVLVAQRHPRDPGAAVGPAHARRGGGAGRDPPAQARGSRALARLRASGQAPRRRRPHPLRRGQREHRLPARQPRRRGRGERGGRRGDACASPLPGRRWTRPSPVSATCRCRPISPASAPPTSATAATIRPSTRSRRAPSPRRRRGCISPTTCSAGSTSAASPGTA